ncbi:MAG: hypothetical protein HC910_22775 [Spirulinaceae cyanobacterium SM2_1_0]|nr:hypothetical protein [Spirulinaceae cyanobacterium SM2_1_0]
MRPETSTQIIGPITIDGLFNPIITFQAATATQAVSQRIFTAPYGCRIASVGVAYLTAATDSDAVTLQIHVPTAGGAPNTGTAVLAAPLTLKTGANTLVYPVPLIATPPNIAEGGAIAVVFAGVVTGLTGLNVTIKLERL